MAGTAASRRATRIGGSERSTRGGDCGTAGGVIALDAATIGRGAAGAETAAGTKGPASPGSGVATGAVAVETMGSGWAVVMSSGRDGSGWRIASTRSEFGSVIETGGVSTLAGAFDGAAATSSLPAAGMV
ncbi:hypothetical protein J2X47_002415 [Sphingomonas sp. BE270]|uniref:hypothetical protein n=1 Tax=Sphingomonas sp. BE270 TaxID=2817726 RepID=UPI0028588D92|nr:hypothetical protein [Sphingomonas sp. BE270]MDR7258229.1 hypothetical protein [Sphingomonas sp. BE270]